eukprot:TRINITY_DN2861_c0_g1_i2.p2 TRINITY_DN2861_c0_g1~~TRINITY_DN2861_c0_g1_i2.p2  ORF type:complete len:397 (+),score=137.44 TRINITY_DN2861_c0_g1_i2:55-1245(+)
MSTVPATAVRPRSPAMSVGSVGKSASSLSQSTITRSRSPETTGTLTPPSSPGSGVAMVSSYGRPVGWEEAQIRRRRRDTEKQKRRQTPHRVKRPSQDMREDPTLRMTRLFVGVMSYTPFFALWAGRGETLLEELGGFWCLPLVVLVGSVVTATVKELGQVRALGNFYLLLSFAVGLVGGSYSMEGVQEQKFWRLLAVCAHGILAGRLRTLQVPTLPPTVLGSHVFWLSMGEVVCMLTRDNALTELSGVASSYGLILLLVALVATVPATVMSLWVGVFGQDNPHGSPPQGNLASRVLHVITWVVSAATPIILALSAAGMFLYFMLPLIWERMLFVAPWGIMFEFGSAISQSDCSKSMFWSESAIHPARRDMPYADVAANDSFGSRHSLSPPDSPKTQ